MLQTNSAETESSESSSVFCAPESITFIALAVLGMSGLRGDSGSAVLSQSQGHAEMLGTPRPTTATMKSTNNQ